MKLITLITLMTLLFTFNLQAQTLVIIKPNDSKLASMQLEEPTLNKAVKKLKKIVLKSSWLKGEWKDDQSGYIFDRDKISLDPDAEIVKEYFIPSNFTVIISDITQELLDAKAIEDADKAERIEVKGMLKDLDKYDTVGEWRSKVNKLLKRLVKDNYTKD